MGNLYNVSHLEKFRSNSWRLGRRWVEKTNQWSHCLRLRHQKPLVNSLQYTEFTQIIANIDLLVNMYEYIVLHMCVPLKAVSSPRDLCLMVSLNCTASPLLLVTTCYIFLISKPTNKFENYYPWSIIDLPYIDSIISPCPYKWRKVDFRVAVALHEWIPSANNRWLEWHWKNHPPHWLLKAWKIRAPLQY